MELAALDVAPRLPPARDAADIAVAVGLLRALELRNEVGQPAQHFGVAGRRVHQRQCRQVVAAHVAIESARLPVTVARLLGLQAGLAQEWCQQAVLLKREDVFEVGRLRIQERAGRQPHVLEGEQFGRLRPGGRYEQGQCGDAGLHGSCALV
jgi:hypothetical protein